MRSSVLALCFGLAACGPGDAPPVADGMHEVEVFLGAEERPVLSLSSATVDEQGGQGQKASATLGGVVPMSVNAARSTWSSKTGELRFEGDVVLERGTLRLWCDTLEVTLAEERLSAAKAAGSVRISDGPRQIRGREAVFDEASQSLVVTGEPELEEAGNRLVGERISIALDGSAVECSQCQLTLRTRGPDAPRP